VASVMAKAALLEQIAISGSTATIFFTLVTDGGVSWKKKVSKRRNQQPYMVAVSGR
jgi:hypothetical protein